MIIEYRLTRAERVAGERGLHTQPTDLVAQLTSTASAYLGLHGLAERRSWNRKRSAKP